MAACSDQKCGQLSGVLLAIALTIPVGAIEKEPLAEYASRRARVVEQIKGNALILFGKANSDLVKFKQEDNFYYLTGFSEPNAVLLIDATGDQPEEILFVEPRNLGQEKWTGVTMSAGAEGQKATGVRSVQVLGEMAPAMARVIQKGRKLFTLTADTRTSRPTSQTADGRRPECRAHHRRVFACGSPRQNWH